MQAHQTSARRQPPVQQGGANSRPLLAGGLRGERGVAAAAPCGWFDSSFELQSGVEVQELSDAQLLALWQALRPGALGTAAAMH